VRNVNGQRIIDFCVDKRLVIGNTVFKHKRIHHIAFVGDGRDVQSVIDYIIFMQGMRRNFRHQSNSRSRNNIGPPLAYCRDSFFENEKESREREKI
jgi:hypothetical protein